MFGRSEVTRRVKKRLWFLKLISLSRLGDCHPSVSSSRCRYQEEEEDSILPSSASLRTRVWATHYDSIFHGNWASRAVELSLTGEITFFIAAVFPDADDGLSSHLYSNTPQPHYKKEGSKKLRLEAIPLFLLYFKNPSHFISTHSQCRNVALRIISSSSSFRIDPNRWSRFLQASPPLQLHRAKKSEFAQ